MYHPPSSEMAPTATTLKVHSKTQILTIIQKNQPAVEHAGDNL
jgi:hypothetical protein